MLLGLLRVRISSSLLEFEGLILWFYMVCFTNNKNVTGEEEETFKNKKSIDLLTIFGQVLRGKIW